LQLDGKILVAGAANQDNWTSRSSVFAVARYHANGSLDTSFGGTGKITSDFGPSSYGQSMALQADGRILMAGYTENTSGNTDFALARYNTNGSLDTSFGGTGKLTSDFGFNSDQGRSITWQPDGKILVAGAAYEYSWSSGSSIFAVARYLANGSLDTSFGGESTLDHLGTYSGMSPVQLAPKAQIFDADLTSYGGTSLTLSRHGGTDPSDVFSAYSSVLTPLTTGSYFSVNGVTIGRVIGNASGSLILGFTTDATQALVSQAMQQIAYANTATIPAAQLQIDWSFDDGNTGAQGTGGALSTRGSSHVTITARNVAPIVAQPLTDLVTSANQTFSHQIPSGTFVDANSGDPLPIAIRMANGTPLPPWLTFDPITRTLSGNPGSFDAGDFDIQFTVTDVAGATVSDIFRLSVTTNPPTCSLIATPTSIRKNGTSILSASCIPATSSYIWTGGTCTGSMASTCVVSPTATTTYTVTGTNYYGPSAPAVTTVTFKKPDLGPILMLLLD
jgi:uncharacterized delta-60 repeat protein